MNRRTLLGGMAAMIPATVAGQTITEDTDTVRLMEKYLEGVVENADPDAIADYLDADAIDLQSAWQEHARIVDGLRQNNPVDVHLILGNDEFAIAYGQLHYTEHGDFDAFVLIYTEGTDLITAYRWMLELAS